jgi:hypothetical protein
MCSGSDGISGTAVSGPRTHRTVSLRVTPKNRIDWRSGTRSDQRGEGRVGRAAEEILDLQTELKADPAGAKLLREVCLKRDVRRHRGDVVAVRTGAAPSFL